MSAKIFTPWLSRIPFSLSSVASTLWRLSMETMPLLVGSGMALFILLQDGRRARPGFRARTRASAPLSRIRQAKTLRNRAARRFASTLWRLWMERMPLLVGWGMALFILLPGGRHARTYQQWH